MVYFYFYSTQCFYHCLINMFTLINIFITFTNKNTNNICNNIRICFDISLHSIFMEILIYVLFLFKILLLRYCTSYFWMFFININAEVSNTVYFNTGWKLIKHITKQKAGSEKSNQMYSLWNNTWCNALCLIFCLTFAVSLEKINEFFIVLLRLLLYYLCLLIFSVCFRRRCLAHFFLVTSFC